LSQYYYRENFVPPVRKILSFTGKVFHLPLWNREVYRTNKKKKKECGIRKNFQLYNIKYFIFRNSIWENYKIFEV
jgi:hypothetical protein